MQKHKVEGIITMEKVLEAYLDTKFLDEKDRSKILNNGLNDTSDSLVSGNDQIPINYNQAVQRQNQRSN